VQSSRRKRQEKRTNGTAIACCDHKAKQPKNPPYPCSASSQLHSAEADLNTNAPSQPFFAERLSICCVNAVLHLISINQPYRSPYTAIVARKIDAIYYVYMIGLLSTEFSILCIFPSASAFPRETILCFPCRFVIAIQSILHSSPFLPTRARKLNFRTLQHLTLCFLSTVYNVPLERIVLIFD
jgi:hypothetical protein